MPENDDKTQIALLNQKIDNFALVSTAQNTAIASAIAEFRAETVRRYDDHEDRLRELENGMTTLKERLTQWQLIQGAFTAIGTAIAAFWKH